MLRRQEGTRLEFTRGPLALAAVLLAVAAVLLAGVSLLRGAGVDVGLLLGTAVVGAVGMYFVHA